MTKRRPLTDADTARIEDMRSRNFGFRDIAVEESRGRAEVGDRIGTSEGP